MLNIHDLESRHRKYKLKSYIPYILISSSLIIITISILFLIQRGKNNSDTTTVTLVEKEAQVQESVQINPKDESSIEKQEVVTKKVQNKPAVVVKEEPVKTKLSLAPSMGFMKKIESNAIKSYETQDVIIKSSTSKTELKPKSITKPKSTTKPVVKKIVKETTPIKVEKKSININRHKDSEDIQHVIKRFKKNNSPALSLFIAKKYYKIGEYHKAYNYALITNEINNDIEDSWIIFAKSLIKLNEREMAIKTLKKYIASSHSSQAKILLDEILSGKFK